MARIVVPLVAVVAAIAFVPEFFRVSGGRAFGDDAARRPNILWLTCEDMSLQLGCYGDKLARTPHIDKLAREGVRYTHAFSTSGVCAPSRSCLITGVYPSSLGTQFMRCKGTLPDFVRCFPEYLRDAGYYCTNNVKTDYNFDPPASAWDESSNRAHWKNRPADKPFFAVFNNVVTHESQLRMRGDDFEKVVRSLPREERHDPAQVSLPPYYPDTPEARLDWAQYLDTISVMDRGVGEHLALLEQQGLADDTIIFFFSDHGVGLPRAKRWLYDSGMHVPLIVRFGRNFRYLAPSAAGTTTDRLVSFVDFAPTVLNLTGITIPTHMQGQAFLGGIQKAPREYVYGIRDRMDETHDLIRAVRDARYKYIRNFMPWVPYSQPLSYAELGPTLQSMRRLHAEGMLTGPPALFFRPTKPAEELYDTDADPHELVNLANAPEHRATLERMRNAQHGWALETLDLGLVPEPDLHARCDPRPPYVVARGPGAGGSLFPLEQLRRTALAASSGREALPTLYSRLDDPDPAVRYWAVTGIGALSTLPTAHVDVAARTVLQRPNNYPAALNIADRQTLSLLQERLRDLSPTVRVAAARALLQFDDDPLWLATLTKELASQHDWVRHHAALGLVELGSRAAPARKMLETALDDRNEYVVRLVKRTLAALDR